MKIREEDLKRELEVALSGKDSQQKCSLRLGMDLRKFKKLLRRARIHGIEAVFYSERPKAYTEEFKLSVVNSVLSGPLSQGMAGARYNLNESTVKAWVEKYREGGKEALLEDNRGRLMGRKKKPKLEDYEPGSIEYLKLENELLKRENLLLKKALPLVQEKIRNRSRAKSGTSSSEN